MNCVVLNGSPKGKTGITLQYVKYIQKHYPQHDYIHHTISASIMKIENNCELYDTILSDIRSADVIIWATPVYTLFVPAQLMRFIDLIHERKSQYSFKNKPVIVLSTSIHFYDHTAHRYMNAVCDDLDMNYLGYFSAEMDDLLIENERTRLLSFADHMFHLVETGTRLQKRFAPVQESTTRFIPETVTSIINADHKSIVIITDATDPDANISTMIQRFSDTFKGSIRYINLWDIDIKGGCTGCIRCGYDNSCAYQDSFSDMYRSEVLPAEIIIFAIELKYRNFSWKFKEFFDRRFYLNHKPELHGKQIGFIVSGPVSQMPYIFDFFDGAIDWQQGNVAGIVRDDTSTSDEINLNLQHLAENAVHLSDKGYVSPQTFLGVGGAKIFRDDIWGKLRYVFQADYRHYKNHGLFNFPHNRYKTRIVNSIMRFLTTIPRFRALFYRKIKTEHYKPHKKAAERY